MFLCEGRCIKMNVADLDIEYLFRKILLAGLTLDQKAKVRVIKMLREAEEVYYDKD